MKIPALSIMQIKTEPSLSTKTPELYPAVDVKQTTPPSWKRRNELQILEPSFPYQMRMHDDGVFQNRFQIDSKKARRTNLEMSKFLS